MNEVWKDLDVEFTDRYKISSFGRFLRKDSNKISIGFYGQITLSDNKTKNFHIDELVLRTFGSYKEEIEVKHIDGDKCNCRLDNLIQQDNSEEGEIWKDIRGYEGLYQISNYGRVKRLARKFYSEKERRWKSVNEMIMKPDSKHQSYPNIALYKNRKYQSHYISILVKTHFLGLKYDDIIDYIDGDRTNCRVDNLCLHRNECVEGDVIWRDIKGYEGYYQVSSDGRVRSLDRYVPSKNDSIKLCRGVERVLALNEHGYLQTSLYNHGMNNKKNGKHYMVHRLVAEAFIPNPENKPEVNHKDGDKLNNNVSNLEWVTKSENVRHAYATGLNSIEQARRNLHKASLVSAELTRIKCKCIETGQLYNSYTEAGELTRTSAIEIKVSCDKHSVCRGLHYCRLDDEYEIGIKDLEGEIWKGIPGYEDRYQISNKGRVKSLARVCKGTMFNKNTTRSVPEKLLSTKYSNITLHKDGRSKTYNFQDLYSQMFGRSNKQLIKEK